MAKDEQKPMTRAELLAIIEQTRRENWEELDLRSKGITELPPEIGQLKRLKKLNLGRDYRKPDELQNKLTQLPDEIGQRHCRSGGQAVVRGDNEHERIAPIGLDLELRMLQGNADHAQVPLPRQHAVDHPLTVGYLECEGDAGIARDEGRQHGRQERDPGRATGAQAQGAPLQPLQFAQRPLRLLG